MERRRQRVGNAGQLGLDQPAQRRLMRRIHRRPQETDRNRLDLAFGDPAQSVASLLLVERYDNVALRIDSLMNLEGQPPQYVGLERGRRQVERIELAALAQHKNVGETFGDQE